jgi:hypothetical protein
VGVSRRLEAWLLSGVVLTGAAVALADSPALPRIGPLPEEFYPPASWRLSEEGRVLVELRLHEHRRPEDGDLQALVSDEWVFEGSGDATLHQFDAPQTRLAVGAMKALKFLFDPSDWSDPDPKAVYRVTIIFCLDPGHCDSLVPFPNTRSIVVKRQRRVQEPERLY